MNRETTIDPSSFDELLSDRSRDIVALLSEPRWKPKAPRDPELRKNLDRLYTAIVDARRLSRARPLDDQARARLCELLVDTPPDSWRSDSLGLRLEEIDQVLISHGDELHLCTLLEIEYASDGGDVDARGRAPLAATGAVTLRRLYGNERIRAARDFAAGERVDDEALEEARERLAAFYRTRHVLYARDRSRAMTQARLLRWLAPLLLALVAGLVAAVDLVADDANWRSGLLAAVAGALGATVSGTYRLRDQLPRLSALRLLWHAFAVQPALGGAAGTFLWLVLEGGIVAVGDPPLDWGTLAAVAFVAGFSEPFVLKTVERLARAGE